MIKTLMQYSYKKLRISSLLSLLSGMMLVNSCFGAVKSRLEMTPDLMQTDKRANLPFGGRPHCGPVAASNAMVYFANQDYPRLSTSKNPSPEEQGKIALELAKHMKTTRSEGTTEEGFLKGLSSYINDKGYKVKSLKYQGWQKVGKVYDSGIKKPKPASILKNLDNKSQVFLKIGWYKYNPQTKTYTRFAGHWVAVVAANSSKNGYQVVIHDSAPRSGVNVHHDLVDLGLIRSGTIKSGWVKPFSAKGMFKLTNQLKIKKSADAGILDAVVILRLQ